MRAPSPARQHTNARDVGGGRVGSDSRLMEGARILVQRVGPNASKKIHAVSDPSRRCYDHTTVTKK